MRRALTPVAAMLAAAVAPAVSACDEKSEPEPAPPVTTTATAAPDDDAEPEADAGEKPSKADREAARRRAELHAIRRTVHEYIAGLDRRDAAGVCALLGPDVTRRLPLPRDRGSCVASLDASIGYRDPRGLPQFAGVELAAIRAIQLGGKQARATTEIVTEFADREEPSLEDDIIYLERTPKGWVIAKPSTAIYRAIGAEPGPESIAPPG